MRKKDFSKLGLILILSLSALFLTSCDDALSTGDDTGSGDEISWEKEDLYGEWFGYMLPNMEQGEISLEIDQNEFFQHIIPPFSQPGTERRYFDILEIKSDTAGIKFSFTLQLTKKEVPNDDGWDDVTEDVDDSEKIVTATATFENDNEFEYSYPGYTPMMMDRQ